MEFFKYPGDGERKSGMRRRFNNNKPTRPNTEKTQAKISIFHFLFFSFSFAVFHLKPSSPRVTASETLSRVFFVYSFLFLPLSSKGETFFLEKGLKMEKRRVEA